MILPGIAPAVLGAMVPLAVLVGRPDENQPDLDDEPIPYQLTYAPDVLDGRSLSPRWDDAPAAAPEPAPDRAAKLQMLRARIATGTYAIDPGQVAEAVIRRVAALRRHDD